MEALRSGDLDLVVSALPDRSPAGLQAIPLTTDTISVVARRQPSAARASGGRSRRARSPIRGSCPDATSCCGRVSKRCFASPGSSRRPPRSNPTRSPSSPRFCATATCCRSRRRRCCAARWAASRRSNSRPHHEALRRHPVPLHGGDHAGDTGVHRGDQGARKRAWNELRRAANVESGSVAAIYPRPPFGARQDGGRARPGFIAPHRSIGRGDRLKGSFLAH